MTRRGGAQHRISLAVYIGLVLRCWVRRVIYIEITRAIWARYNSQHVPLLGKADIA